MNQICQRDGEYCLIFRLRDYDRRYECRNEIKAYLVQRRGAGNSQVLLTNIRLENTGFMLWPIEVVHKINKTSRFWDLSAKDLITKKFEIIVVMEGISISTGNTSKTTTSYLSNEILWGHQFVSCVDYDKDTNCYIVNHKLFNTTKEVVMPLCSAQRLTEVIYETAVSTTPPVSSLGVDNSTLESSSITVDVSPDNSSILSRKTPLPSPIALNSSDNHQLSTDGNGVDSLSSMVLISTEFNNNNNNKEKTERQDHNFEDNFSRVEQFIISPSDRPLSPEDDKLKNTSLMLTSNKANKRTYNETSF